MLHFASKKTTKSVVRRHDKSPIVVVQYILMFDFAHKKRRKSVVMVESILMVHLANKMTIKSVAMVECTLMFNGLCIPCVRKEEIVRM